MSRLALAALIVALVLVVWSRMHRRADIPACWPNEEDGFDAWLAATFDEEPVRR